MPGIDDVLERLVSEPGFRDDLSRDPKRALDGYDLSADDLEVLASELTEEAGGSGPVEARTTKAGLFGLLASLVDTPVDVNDLDGDGLTNAEGDDTGRGFPS